MPWPPGPRQPRPAGRPAIGMGGAQPVASRNRLASMRRLAPSTASFLPPSFITGRGVARSFSKPNAAPKAAFDSPLVIGSSATL